MSFTGIKKVLGLKRQYSIKYFYHKQQAAAIIPERSATIRARAAIRGIRVLIFKKEVARVPKYLKRISTNDPNFKKTIFTDYSCIYRKQHL